MGLTDIGKYSEAAEQFINELAKAFREKHWVKILSLVGVVFALLLNPLSADYGLKLVRVEKPTWYSYRLWLIVTASFFVAAFLVALLTKKRAEPETTTTATSIIKGLLHYTNSKEDAEWFARLQRERILHECMSFCLGADSSFAILSGESGTGKTSFLQAGLYPNLGRQGQRPVYVKFTDSPPLDSIRQSLTGDSENSASDEAQSLLDCLRKATRDEGRPIVLLFDQFEQFFAHHKSKTSRKPFIQQMAQWHKHDGSLPVKILISIRGDFADKLIEFQREMEYTLTPHNMFRLEKFEPQEAAQVIRVIAKEAKIELDEGFVREITKHELADREDGTVSPVDIQIFSWMIDGQKSSEERAFNRKAFQKLGGVEGLLERFLKRALDARETDARRQAAIEVLLALTDQNVRAGALSLKDLKEKLSGIISDDNLVEAVSWLSKSEIRLITSIQEKTITYYELSHERIIPPLRRVAAKEITAIEEAKRTLDRRVHEWIGNNRARRYLLTFKEWRLIRRYRPLITLGSQKQQKEEFVSRSRRRLLARGLTFTAILLLGLGGYAGYTWYEARPETQIHYTQERLVELLGRSKDAKATTYASFLLLVLETEKDPELSQKLQGQIDSTDPFAEKSVLLLLTEAYIKLGKIDEALKTLPYPRPSDTRFDPPSKVKVKESLFVAETFIKLSKTDKAVLLLDDAQQTTQELSPSDKAEVLPLLAEAYIKLGKIDEAEKVLNQAQQTAENLDIFAQVKVLRAMGEAYVKLGKMDEAKKVFNQAQQATKSNRYYYRWMDLSSSLLIAYTKAGKIDEAEQVFNQALGQELPPADILLSLAEAYIELGKTDKAKKILGLIRQEEIYASFFQEEMLLPFTEAHLKLGKADEVIKFLAQVQHESETSGVLNMSTMLPSVAETYIKLGKMDEAEKVLAQVQQAVNYIPLDRKTLALVKVATLYAKLHRWKEALAVAESIGNEVYAVAALSKILIIWKDTQNGTKNMDNLEEVFQRVDSLFE